MRVPGSDFRSHHGRMTPLGSSVKTNEGDPFWCKILQALSMRVCFRQVATNIGVRLLESSLEQLWTPLVWVDPAGSCVKSLLAEFLGSAFGASILDWSLQIPSVTFLVVDI